MRRALLPIACFAVLILAAPGLAARGRGESSSHTVTAEAVWARPAPRAGGNSAVYFRITNVGSGPVQLLSASSTVAQTVELHTHIMDGDVARMRMVPRVDLAPGETVEFRPGGLHVMLIGLLEPLVPEMEIPLILTFRDAPDLELTAIVRR